MEQTNKRPLVILTGPTAVGKTAASIGLAKAIGGEIISADSMQVYREMDIGSAKIRPEEMDGVPHHLVDVLDPSEDFNVVLFQQMAKEAMEGIYQRGHIPIVVGGTGFYIQALLYDIDFTENNADTAYREELEALAKTQGAEYLHESLAEPRKAGCGQIHPQLPFRAGQTRDIQLLPHQEPHVHDPKGGYRADRKQGGGKPAFAERDRGEARSGGDCRAGRDHRRKDAPAAAADFPHVAFRAHAEQGDRRTTEPVGTHRGQAS